MFRNVNDTSSLLFINLHPSGDRVIFNWGGSVLQMTKSTMTLGYKEQVFTEVPVGELFVRLRQERSRLRVGAVAVGILLME